MYHYHQSFANVLGPVTRSFPYELGHQGFASFIIDHPILVAYGSHIILPRAFVVVVFNDYTARNAIHHDGPGTHVAR